MLYENYLIWVMYPLNRSFEHWSQVLSPGLYIPGHHQYIQGFSSNWYCLCNISMSLSTKVNLHR